MLLESEIISYPLFCPFDGIIFLFLEEMTHMRCVVFQDKVHKSMLEEKYAVKGVLC